MQDRRSHNGVTLQCAVGAITLIVMSLRPPERGPMLLLPILGGSLADTINLARGADAGLLAPGPLPGSIIVRGDRRRIDPLLVGRGIIALAAPANDCGANRLGSRE